MNKIALDPITDELIDTGEAFSYPHQGCPHTEETKEKISIALRGRSQSEESKAKRHGKPSGMSGKHHTEETKQRIRYANSLIFGSKHPNYGKHLSEQTKEKLRLANIGKHYSNETREKMRLAQQARRDMPILDIKYVKALTYIDEPISLRIKRHKKLGQSWIPRKYYKLCPVCGEYTFREAISPHHIKPVEDGGKDIPRNRVRVCKQCHDTIEAAYDDLNMEYCPALIRLSQINLFEAR